MKKPTRILLFSLVYFPRYVGGAEVAIREITDRIADEDCLFDMVVLDSEGPRYEQIGNVHLYRVISRKKFTVLHKYWYIAAAFFKALKLHRQYKYDIAWAMMANYAGFAALFFKLIHPNVHFLLSLQEGDSFSHIMKRVGALRWLYKKIFTKADQVQAISNYLAKFGLDMGFKGKPVVIPNGVNNSNFSRRDEDKIIEIKNKFQKKDGDIFLVTASRLTHKNGVVDIISSLKYLPENYRALIVGVGELEEDLRQQAKDMGVEGRVIFAGYVAHEVLPQYLHASDIFIRPSYSEGLGNSFIEAMASRIPVIATEVGGIPDFLIPEETGLFCEVGNPKSIAEAVLKLNNSVLKGGLIQNAYEMVKTKYDWQLISEDMKSLLTLKIRNDRV